MNRMLSTNCNRTNAHTHTKDFSSQGISKNKYKRLYFWMHERKRKPILKTTCKSDSRHKPEIKMELYRRKKNVWNLMSSRETFAGRSVNKWWQNIMGNRITHRNNARITLKMSITVPTHQRLMYYEVVLVWYSSKFIVCVP